MIKFCKEQWMKNEGELRNILRKEKKRNEYNYKDLVKLVVSEILNKNNDDINWDENNITEIDNGDYQGTLLYLIPLKTYQPCEYEYLMTHVSYGSCSGCDTLASIQWGGCNDEEEEIEEYVTLCRDLVNRIIKPYNSGWRQEDIYETVEI